MSQDIANSVKRELQGMGRAERQLTIEKLKAVLLDSMYQTEVECAPYEVKCCPRCGCVEVVKKGKAKDGSQRYLCHGCGRTFGVRTGKVIGSSKLPANKWVEHARCFADGLSLRASAHRIGVSLPTSLFMRRRILEVISRFNDAFAVGEGCGCELDETYFRESFKGNHANGSFRMPRKPRHRGGEVTVRGLSKEQICVMSGVNDTDGSLLDLAGRGSLSARRALNALRDKVQEGSLVATDKAGAYPAALRELRVAAHVAYDSWDRSEGAINRVNALHSALDHFMSRFRGVSTKHLKEYLEWFRWVCEYGGEDAIGVLLRQMESSVCHTSLAECWNVEPPYMEYWADSVA